MVMTGSTTDYLTRIRNANMVKHDSVEIPASTIKRLLSKILKQEGFIHDYEVVDDNKQGIIKIFLKCGPNGERVIFGLKRISKPGLRNYVGVENLPKVLSSLGVAIVSTSTGVITSREAKERSASDGVLIYIW